MHKVLSKFSPDREIREDQYIAEIICENRAANLKMSLPARFWSIPEWANFFVYQIKFIGPLIEEHGFEKTLSFVKKRRIYNISVKWVREALSKYKYENDIPKDEVKFVDLTSDSVGVINKPKKFDYLD